MEILIVHPQTEDKLQALKIFLEEQQIEFEHSPYDPEFVNKIKQGDIDFEKGNFTKITLDDIWK